jgi:hypothetical protein
MSIKDKINISPIGRFVFFCSAEFADVLRDVSLPT